MTGMNITNEKHSDLREFLMGKQYSLGWDKEMRQSHYGAEISEEWKLTKRKGLRGKNGSEEGSLSHFRNTVWCDYSKDWNELYILR